MLSVTSTLSQAKIVNECRQRLPEPSTAKVPYYYVAFSVLPAQRSYFEQRIRGIATSPVQKRCKFKLLRGQGKVWWEYMGIENL